ncbi:hypothetical protein [Desulforhopalus sp. 52FAK]
MMKSFLKKGFRKVGIEIRRVEERRSIPPVLDDPFEALHHNVGLKKAAFHCPMAKCVSPHGFSFSKDGWHPLSATLAEFHNGICTKYNESVVKSFFEKWQPRNLSEAIVCLDQPILSFEKLPSYLLLLAPWIAQTPEELLIDIKSWCRKDYIEHDQPDFNFDTHGFQFHGPAHKSLVHLEFHRLHSIYQSIMANGYVRDNGDITVWLLKRGSEIKYYRFGPGSHRIAALMALGYEDFPAVFFKDAVIDIEDVDYWPQVRRGFWSKKNAQMYFDGLFDFDSLSWAKKMGLSRT